MTVWINEEEHTLDAGSTVLDALARVGITPETRGVAVAVGDEVIRRAEWSSTVLSDGAKLEVVTAVQGG